MNIFIVNKDKENTGYVQNKEMFKYVEILSLVDTMKEDHNGRKEETNSYNY